MKSTKNQIGTATGVMAAIVLACLPCCIPLIAPVLAWLGISTLGAAATGWYAGMAGAFVLGFAAILFVRHRIAARRAAATQCGCRGGCRVNFSSTGERL